MKVNISLQIGDFVRRMEKAERLAMFGAKQAVDEWAERIEQQSMLEVPRDTGALASSFFKESEMSAAEYAVTVGYGGESATTNPASGQPTSDYALRVHEDLSASHPGGGKAKFLEDPVIDSTSDFASDSADTIRRYLGG